jgi:hypothetical protein
MKTLILAFLLATTTLAQAQEIRGWPKTIKFTSDTGEVVGTITQWNGVNYVRDLKGKLIAQVIIMKDGTKTFLDVSGQPIDDPPSLKNLILPE